MRLCVELLEVLFLIEILCNFFTAYKDPENFDSVFSLKKIAQNYILRAGFLKHLLAVFPYHFVLVYSPSDPNEQVLRNVLLLKLIRLLRLSTESFPNDTLLTLFQNQAESRDDKIANDRLKINIIKIVKQLLATLITTYLLGLLWYRFSDYCNRILLPD